MAGKQHHLVYDFGFKVNLTEVNLILPGAEGDTTNNPKCVSISYCTDASHVDGVWLPSKRQFVPEVEESTQVLPSILYNF